MELPLEIPERTQFSDEAYGVLGRALSFATEFEGNCRALSLLIGLSHQPDIMRDRASRARCQILISTLVEVERPLETVKPKHVPSP